MFTAGESHDKRPTALVRKLSAEPGNRSAHGIFSSFMDMRQSGNAGLTPEVTGAAGKVFTMLSKTWIYSMETNWKKKNPMLVYPLNHHCFCLKKKVLKAAIYCVLFFS